MQFWLYAKLMICMDCNALCRLNWFLFWKHLWPKSIPRVQNQSARDWYDAVPVAPPGLPGLPSEALRRREIFPANVGERSRRKISKKISIHVYIIIYIIYPSIESIINPALEENSLGCIWMYSKPPSDFFFGGTDRNGPSGSIICDRGWKHEGLEGKVVVRPHILKTRNSEVTSGEVTKSTKMKIKSLFRLETYLQQKIHGRFLRVRP